jgi:hypothetical protein
VETEGYSCREIYVDTFKVNFSAAAEEVAAMLRVSTGKGNILLIGSLNKYH